MSALKIFIFGFAVVSVLEQEQSTLVKNINVGGINTDSNGIRCNIYKGKKNVPIPWNDIAEIKLIDKNKFIWLLPDRHHYSRNNLNENRKLQSASLKILIRLTDLKYESIDIKSELNIRLLSYQLVH